MNKDIIRKIMKMDGFNECKKEILFSKKNGLLKK